MGGPSFLDPGGHLQTFLLGERDRVERDGDLAALCVAAGLASPGGDFEAPSPPSFAALTVPPGLRV